MNVSFITRADLKIIKPGLSYKRVRSCHVSLMLLLAETVFKENKHGKWFLVFHYFNKKRSVIDL